MTVDLIAHWYVVRREEGDLQIERNKKGQLMLPFFIIAILLRFGLSLYIVQIHSSSIKNVVEMTASESRVQLCIAFNFVHAQRFCALGSYFIQKESYSYYQKKGLDQINGQQSTNPHYVYLTQIQTYFFERLLNKEQSSLSTRLLLSLRCVRKRCFQKAQAQILSCHLKLCYIFRLATQVQVKYKILHPVYSFHPRK